MKKYKKTIITALVFWIPLAVVTFIHTEKDSMLMRITGSIASGPIVFFLSGVASFLIGALCALSVYLVRNLEIFHTRGENAHDPAKAFEYGFNGSFAVVFAIMYYLTITNQHVLLKLYGGW